MADLNVLHFSTSDQEGGSARSAWRIHTGLKELGVTSRMIVSQKLSGSDDVECVAPTRMGQRIDSYTNIVLQKLGYQYQYIPSQTRLKRHPWVKKADIIQLFNTHGGYFNLSLLPEMSKTAKLVWRLSDLWPLTGHCAYPGACDLWQQGCGSCPDLQTYPPIGRDRTAQHWQRKAQIYSKSDITVVAPSSWTKKAAEQSPFFAGQDIRLIHNGINLSNYKPIETEQARAALGIDTTKTVLFFGVHVAFDNPRKGTDILLEALHKLDNPDQFLLLTAGYGSEKWQNAVPLNVVSLGYLDSDEALKTANAAADFILTPSVVENLPNTIIEAMAMGKPAIAFDSGGIGDAVVHGLTGFLVPERSAQALADTLNGLDLSPDRFDKMSHAARKWAEDHFDEKKEAQSFKALYVELLGR